MVSGVVVHMALVLSPSYLKGHLIESSVLKSNIFVFILLNGYREGGGALDRWHDSSQIVN